MANVAKVKNTTTDRAKVFTKKVTPAEVRTTTVGVMLSMNSKTPHTKYTIQVHAVWGVRTWTCSCPSFIYQRDAERKPCKHLKGLWEGTLAKGQMKMTPQGGKILTEERKLASKRVGRPSIVKLQLELGLEDDVAEKKVA